MKTAYVLESKSVNPIVLGYFQTLHSASQEARRQDFWCRIIKVVGPSFGEGYHQIIREYCPTDGRIRITERSF